VSGNLSGKNCVLAWIKTHPSASADDLSRVQVAEFDWQRRTGNPTAALKGLEEMTEPESTIGKVERSQALTYVLLLLGQQATDLTTKLGFIERAAANQESNVDLAMRSEEIPADKKIHYLVGLCDARGQIMRLTRSPRDPVIERMHIHLDKLAQDPSIGLDHRRRLAWELPLNSGVYYRDAGLYPRAREMFSAAWDCLRDTTNERYKCVLAIMYLCAVLEGETRGNLCPMREHRYWKEATEYLRALPAGALLPADRPGYEQELKLLEPHVGKI
jgi:hypothetical protein